MPSVPLGDKTEQERAVPPRPFTSVTGTFRRIADRLAAASQPHPDGRRSRLAIPFLGLRVLIQVVRQWARDRCPQQAASLAFQTALSIVPLVAIALSMLKATGALEAESALIETIGRQINPVSRDEITQKIVEWSRNLDFRSAGLAGVVSTLVLSFFMYASVERIYNDIWRVERRRSLGQQFIVFYALVTLIPMLLGISLYHAARYGLTSGWAGSLGALVATWGALFMANKLLPATKVAWRSAAWGALFSALAFEAAKHLFQLYVAEVAFRKYAGVYGTLGLVPIVLIWIYYSWLVVLLGAEVAHSSQHLTHLELLDRRRLSPEVEALEKVNGLVAARLLCAVIEAWRREGHATAASSLAIRFDLSEEIVERIFRRLKDARLVIEVDGDTEGYLPARAPSEITLADVLSPFRGSDVMRRGRNATRLDQTLDELESAIQERSALVTLDELTDPALAQSRSRST